MRIKIFQIVFKFSFASVGSAVRKHINDAKLKISVFIV